MKHKTIMQLITVPEFHSVTYIKDLLCCGRTWPPIIWSFASEC